MAVDLALQRRVDNHRMLLRSALAGLLIIVLTAGASATAALMEIDKFVPPPDDIWGPAPAPPLANT